MQQMLQKSFRISEKYLIEIKTGFVTILLCLVFALTVFSAKFNLVFLFYFNGFVLFFTINRLVHYYFKHKKNIDIKVN